MKVLNLSCQIGHVFEGWFGSESDFQDQLANGLLTCPVCGNGRITKQLSAPRLNLSSSQAPQPSPGSASPDHGSAVVCADRASSDRHLPKRAPRPAMPPALAAQWNDMVTAALRVVVANTEDVGTAFAQEARRMHRGEAEAKSIRGRTTASEARALREEGIDVVPLPVFDEPPGRLQ